MEFLKSLAPTFVAVTLALVTYGFLKAVGVSKLEQKLESLVG